MIGLFNGVSIFAGFAGGLILSVIGGWDMLLGVLVLLMVFDYVTGVLKGYFLKKLDSDMGFWGIVKKFIMLIIVSMAYVLSNLVEPVLPLREIVIVFFISNEGISILENAAVFIPIPDELKKALNKLREDNEKE